MTSEQFQSLKAGDKVKHASGAIYTVYLTGIGQFPIDENGNYTNVIHEKRYVSISPEKGRVRWTRILPHQIKNWEVV